jgi:sulfoxide reductase heme-binding subunit YedZ
VSRNPTHVIWWLVSQASGIVALGLVSISVMLGLAMACRLVPGRRKRAAVRLHEYLAVGALVAIGAHGAALLGDAWLKPGLAGITVPFALGYRPAFTSAGIVAGYLALALGPSFYLRKRIGARTWRRMHRATALVWMLGVVHTLGAGSNASSPWLQALVLAPGALILYLLLLRVLGSQRRETPAPVPARRAPHGSGPPQPLPGTLAGR